MAKRVHFAIPGDIATPTGGYGYDRRVMAGLGALGWHVKHVVLPEGIADRQDGALAEAEGALAALPDGALLMVDGLALGVMPEAAERLAARLRLVALVHHPLADETGLSEDDVARLSRSETQALAHASAVICTSHTTAERLVSGFGVAPERLTVALPGTDRHPRTARSGTPPRILSLAAVVPRKGHDVLLAALAKLDGMEWTCRIVGSLDRDPAWVDQLRGQAARLGLAERVIFAGPTEAPEEELRAADIFALPSRNEGFGMAFAEALAHGLPIVACAAGAVPEVVPQDAGLLVRVDDADAFAAALSALVSDPELRRRKGEAAWQAGQALPGWDATAGAIARVLDEVSR